MDVVYFRSPAEMRRWLERHHATARELWVGFRKKATGEPSITWPESIAEALCYGWIDGVRRRVDASSYTVRFGPRRTGSVWSSVNVRRYRALERDGRIRPAGAAAFETRRERLSRSDLPEPPPDRFGPPYETRFRESAEAWAYFRAQPPGYRRLMVSWVTSAKREETRLRRLGKLIERSARGERVPP